MPDNDSGKDVKQESVQQGPEGEAVHAQPPPDSPDAQDAQAVSQQSMATEIHGLEDQIRGAEKWMSAFFNGGPWSVSSLLCKGNSTK
jgi:hypothetical protein